MKQSTRRLNTFVWFVGEHIKHVYNISIDLDRVTFMCRYSHESRMFISFLRRNKFVGILDDYNFISLRRTTFNGFTYKVIFA